MPKTIKKEVEVVLEKRVSKRTKGQVYFQYLVTWKGQQVEDASWLTTTELQKYGVNPKSLRDDYFLPRESDAGASSTLRQREESKSREKRKTWTRGAKQGKSALKQI